MTRTKYKCKKCNYIFSRNSDISFKYCPYCGSSGTIEIDTGDSASRLLNEVSSYDRID